MSQLHQDAAPIIAAGIAYWSDWVEQLNRVPTPAFLRKHDLIWHTAKMAVKIQETRQATATLTLSTFPLVEASGHWPQWMALLEKLTSHFDDINQELQPVLLNRLAQLYRLSRRFSEAEALHLRASDLAGQFSIEGLMQGAILFQLAEDYREMQRPDLAKEAILRALQFVTQGPRSDILLASSTHTLAQINQVRGNLQEAIVWYKKSIEVWQRTNQPVELARVLNNFAVVLLAQGKFEEALTAYQQVLAQLENVSSPSDVALAKYNIGCCYMHHEQYEQAEAMFRETALFMRQQIWTPPFRQVQNTQNLGFVILKQGRFSEAEAFLRQSGVIWAELGDELGLANCLDSLAEALCNQGELEEGCRLYRQALALLVQYPDDPQAKAMYAEFSQPYAAFACEELLD